MDGEYLWTDQPQKKTYSRSPLTVTTFTPQREAALSTCHRLPPAGGSLDDIKVVRSETIQVDGQPHDCWVTESHVRSGNSVPIPDDIRDALETVWYDKILGLALMRTMVAEMRPSPPPSFLLTAKTTVHGLKINSSFEDSLFVFGPPADEKDVTGSFRTSAPKALKSVRPVYPPDAKAAGVHGAVLISAIISKDGTPRELSLISGHPLLVDAAMAAAKQWTFSPALLNGKPVELRTTITLNF
jgi:TonB family protein